MSPADDEHGSRDQQRGRPSNEDRVTVREPVAEIEPPRRAGETGHRAPERAQSVGHQVGRVEAVDDRQPHAVAEVAGEPDRRVQRTAVEHVIAAGAGHRLGQHGVQERARQPEARGDQRRDDQVRAGVGADQQKREPEGERHARPHDVVEQRVGASRLTNESCRLASEQARCLTGSRAFDAHELSPRVVTHASFKPSGSRPAVVRHRLQRDPAP